MTDTVDPVADAVEAAKGSRPAYAVPAVEKALDVLELLAEGPALTASQIAQRLDRSFGELFRILQCLERRRVIERHQPGDRYGLTAQLLKLGLSHPPMDRLLTSAMPVMQALAERMHQSCHLAVRNAAHILIAAQVPSPGSVAFNVRRGAQFPLTDSVSGRVLLAYRGEVERRLWLGAVAEDSRLDPAPADLDATLELIRRRGYEIANSRVCPGVTDIGVPVIDDSGHAVAALTVPYFQTVETRIDIERVPAELRDAALQISRTLGGARFLDAPDLAPPADHR